MIDHKKINNLLKKADLDVNLSVDDLEKPFSDIGLDSLDVFAFLSEVEIFAGITFSDEDFQNIKTFNDVIRIVKPEGIN